MKNMVCFPSNVNMSILRLMLQLFRIFYPSCAESNVHKWSLFATRDLSQTRRKTPFYSTGLASEDAPLLQLQSDQEHATRLKVFAAPVNFSRPSWTMEVFWWRYSSFPWKICDWWRILWTNVYSRLLKPWKSNLNPLEISLICRTRPGMLACAIEIIKSLLGGLRVYLSLIWIARTLTSY